MTYRTRAGTSGRARGGAGTQRNLAANGTACVAGRRTSICPNPRGRAELFMASIACRSSSDTAWLGGVDGYCGGVFYNETTSALNYGYDTSSPPDRLASPRRCMTRPTTTAARRSRFPDRRPRQPLSVAGAGLPRLPAPGCLPGHFLGNSTQHPLPAGAAAGGVALSVASGRTSSTDDTQRQGTLTPLPPSPLPLPPRLQIALCLPANSVHLCCWQNLRRQHNKYAIQCFLHIFDLSSQSLHYFCGRYFKCLQTQILVHVANRRESINSTTLIDA